MPALPPRAQQKPFTQEQVVSIVRDGFGDESGAKLIEQRGIDFAPSEDFYQTLKAAGASEAFINALRAAVAPGLSPAHAALKGGSTTAGPPASAKKPLNQVQVITLLAGQVPSHRVSMLVQECGIDFEPTDDYLQEVRLAGGEDELISAIKSAKVTKPVTVDPAAQARQAKVQQHVARGAELGQKGQYAEAEVEYRSALIFDPQSAYLYDSLANALINQTKWDDAASAEREALRLDPKDELARDGLFLAHLEKGRWLEDKGEWDGAIAEYSEAMRVNPNNDLAHGILGHAHVGKALWLMNKSDWDGAISEYREALRLDPNDGWAHFGVGAALERKGDQRGALEEYRTAYTLDPKTKQFKDAYEGLLRELNGP